MAENIFIPSDQIRIFPSTERFPNSQTTVDTGTDFATEYNLSSIVNKLLKPLLKSSGKDSVGGFVINNSFEISEPAEFNIAGYYIRVSSWQQILNCLSGNSSEQQSKTASFVKFSQDEAGDVYAAIEISESDDNLISYRYMVGKDTDSNENSSTTVGTATNAVYTLKLLEKTGTTYRIPDQSKLQFNNLFIGSGALLDGGEL